MEQPTDIINPFIYNRPLPPAFFVGREDIIRRCRSRLAGSVRNNLAISGEQGIGKTSLLRYLMYLAQDKQWGQPYTRNIFLYLDCQTIKEFTPTHFWQRVLELLKETQHGSSLSERIDTLNDQPEIDTFDIERLLKRLSREGVTIVVMLDSFTRIVKIGAAETSPDVVGYFLAGLRALTNLPEGALTMLTATRQHLDLECYDIVKDRPDSKFYNNFHFESLPPFTVNEIEALLGQALRPYSYITFNQGETSFLQRMAGAHPGLLQMAGFHLFEARSQGPLNPQAYKQVVGTFKGEADRLYFPSFWGNSSPLEQTLLILIILAPLSENSAWRMNITPQEIQHLFQKYERNLDDLVKRGLITRVGEIYQIFSVVFAWWIAQEIASKSEAKLAQDYQALEVESLRRAWQTFIDLAPHLTLDRQAQGLIKRKRSTRPKMFSADPFSSAGSLLGVLESRYELQKEVGRGTSGVVYRAFDTRLNRTVAIKWLDSPLAMATIDSRHHLLEEARVTCQLDHRHIVTVYDVIETNDQIYLVMEYLEGQTLAHLLKEKKRLSLEQIITLIEQATAALDSAHKQGIIHRDIKPANLIITAQGLKLTDFGIAKIIKDSHSSESTGLKGTPLYMSPEQIDEKPLDGRSDLFSLAMVAFEMLSGVVPWSGTSEFDLMSNIVKIPPPSLVDLNAPLATNLEPVFQKALAKTPDDRYQCGADFVEALKIAVTSSPSSEVKATNTETKEGKRPKRAAVFSSSDETYNLPSIRELLISAFDDDELNVLCFDHFRQVYDSFTAGMSKIQKTLTLLGYCQRQKQMEELLVLIKERNPQRYDQFKEQLKSI